MKAKSKKKTLSRKRPARASPSRAPAKSPRPAAPPPAKAHEGNGQADMQSILSEVRGAANERKHLEHWEQVECPYCGEGFEVHIDSAEDGQTLYEDCHVCCKPISLHVQVEEEEVHVGIARA